MDKNLTIPDDFRIAFAKLSNEFDRQNLPPKLLDRNLLIAAWNIRHLISYHPEWLAIPRVPLPLRDEIRNPETTSRDLFSLHFIARTIARFDIVLLTEVRAGAEAVRAIHEILGRNWGLLIPDVSEARHGNERLVYFFDRRKVTPSGLVCEIVLPALDPTGRRRRRHRQFARPPYVAGFECGRFAFTLIALHIKLQPETREEELATITERLHMWQKLKDQWAPNLIALGDFQLHDTESPSYQDNPLYKAFTSKENGLFIPEPLRNIRNVIFADPGVSGGLAWFKDSLDMQTLNAGTFDFVDILEEIRFEDFDFSQVHIPKQERDPFWQFITYEAQRRKAYAIGKYISDKLPLWVEFSIRENKYTTNNG